MWKVGDLCLAEYTGDGEYYPAVISRISEGEEAIVKYCDYSSDENGIIPLGKLKRCKRDSSKENKSTKSSSLLRTGLVSPLRYLPEEVRIRDKYADLDKEILLGTDPLKASLEFQSPSTVKDGGDDSKKMTKEQRVVFGGKRKMAPQRANEKLDTSPNELSSKMKKDPPNLVLEKDVKHIKQLQGFTEEELEKPYFPGKTDAGPKVPFVLSEEGTQKTVEIPATMNRYLREYQREGVRFLYQHFLEDKGAILADDMGLGKTIQVLAFICAILHKKGSQKDCQRSLPLFLRDEAGSTVVELFLIICPNSVLYNWLEELDTWTYCSVGKYHGKDREETLAKALRGRLDVVVTTFETYRLKLESLLEITWTAVIVDEVHKIKESNSQITVALKKINTKRRYGLTGTALQNKMGELWCVLDWANPGCLGTWKEFKRKYEINITKGQRYDASKRELAAGRKAALEFSKLRGAWLLRRTKSVISDQFPTKDEKVVFCKLTDLQISITRALLNSEEMKLVLMQHDPCDCGSGVKKGKCHYKKTTDGLSVKAVTFSLMSALIKAANHAALLIPSPGMPSLQKHLSEKIAKLAFAGHPEFVKLTQEARFTTLSDPHYCGKMMILEKLLGIFKMEGSKVLLFSYYTKLLDILEMYLRTTDYIYYRLDGKTSASDRQKLVNGFNRDQDVFLFLISTKAGGMGLNLTGANVVVIFDPNWNPMYDLQAQDRAYRIGQHRDVRVYRLISTGCIEENMYLRQVYKQQLSTVAMTTENAKRYFTAVAGEEEQKGELFGLKNLFTLRTEGSCLTRDLIQREVKAEKGIKTAKYIPLKVKSEDEDEHHLLVPEDDVSEDVASDDIPVCSDQSESSSDEGDTHGLASQLYQDSADNISPSEEESETVHKRSRKKEDKGRQRRKKHYDSESNSSEEDDDDKHGLLRIKGKAIVTKGGKIISKAKSSTGDESKKQSTQHVTEYKGTNMSASPSVLNVGHSLHQNGRYSGKGVGMKGRRVETSSGERRVAGMVDEDAGTGDVRRVDEADGSTDTTSSQSYGDPESKVFRECGVAYVHSNLKVIGASRVEDHVSKTALADVYDNHRYSQEPAFCRVPALEKQKSSSESDDVELKQLKPTLNTNKSVASNSKSVDTMSSKSTQQKRKEGTTLATFRSGETTIFVGQTPSGIRREQLKDMAKVLDFSSVDTLAYTIATGTEDTCKDLLHRYYQTKYPSLVVERYLEVSKEEGMVDQRVTEGSKASQKSKIPVKAINAPKPRKCGGKYRRQWKKPEGIGKFNSDNSSSSEDDRQTVGDHTRRKK
ncbi:uncharacterized protein [Apostichopus japonicus]|uniref:uncharacterized protein isoform X1 n=1 Tax=Stichopus japonicus TaxID=307972 RepID=UPI003AB55774